MIKTHKIMILSVLCAKFVILRRTFLPSNVSEICILDFLTSFIFLHLNFHLEYILMERTR